MIDINYWQVKRVSDCYVDIPKNKITKDTRFNLGAYTVVGNHFSQLNEMTQFLSSVETDQIFASELEAFKTALDFNQRMIEQYTDIVTNSFDSFE